MICYRFHLFHIDRDVPCSVLSYANDSCMAQAFRRMRKTRPKQNKTQQYEIVKKKKQTKTREMWAPFVVSSSVISLKLFHQYSVRKHFGNKKHLIKRIDWIFSDFFIFFWNSDRMPLTFVSLTNIKEPLVRAQVSKYRHIISSKSKHFSFHYVC